MKTIQIILLVALSMNIFGQQHYPLKAQDENIPDDCEVMAIKAADLITRYIERNNIDSMLFIINSLSGTCGTTEWSQRMRIIGALLYETETAELIKFYFENDLHYVYRNRVFQSEKIDYGYIYPRSKSYYGFVPLNHPIDLLSKTIAHNLITNKNLNADEHLICILFSGNLEQFDAELSQKSNKNSFVANYIKDSNRNYRNSWLAYNVYTGIYSPLGNRKVFSNSPLIGITFGTPFSNKLLVELGMKIRININDNEFKYFALGDTNTVNSDISVFFGGLVGYKLVDKKNLAIVPKLGIGIESVSTGISKKDEKTNETKYYDVETIHISLGISALTPILDSKYLGYEISWHYTPYNLVENLHTKFDNTSVSSQIFIRF